MIPSQPPKILVRVVNYFTNATIKVIRFAVDSIMPSEVRLRLRDDPELNHYVFADEKQLCFLDEYGKIYTCPESYLLKPGHYRVPCSLSNQRQRQIQLAFLNNFASCCPNQIKKKITKKPTHYNTQHLSHIDQNQLSARRNSSGYLMFGRRPRINVQKTKNLPVVNEVADEESE